MIAFLGRGETGESVEPLTAHVLPDASASIVETRRQRSNMAELSVHLSSLAVQSLNLHVLAATQRLPEGAVISRSHIHIVKLFAQVLCSALNYARAFNACHRRYLDKEAFVSSTPSTRLENPWSIQAIPWSCKVVQTEERARLSCTVVLCLFCSQVNGNILYQVCSFYIRLYLVAHNAAMCRAGKPTLLPTPSWLLVALTMWLMTSALKAPHICTRSFSMGACL